MNPFKVEVKSLLIKFIFIIHFIVSVNITFDIRAESILGSKDDSEANEFETCSINENNLVEESVKPTTETKDSNQKRLFLSEGGW